MDGMRMRRKVAKKKAKRKVTKKKAGAKRVASKTSASVPLCLYYVGSNYAGHNVLSLAGLKSAIDSADCGEWFTLLKNAQREAEDRGGNNPIYKITISGITVQEMEQSTDYIAKGTAKAL